MLHVTYFWTSSELGMIFKELWLGGMVCDGKGEIE